MDGSRRIREVYLVYLARMFSNDLGSTRELIHLIHFLIFAKEEIVGCVREFCKTNDLDLPTSGLRQAVCVVSNLLEQAPQGIGAAKPVRIPSTLTQIHPILSKSNLT